MRWIVICLLLGAGYWYFTQSNRQDVAGGPAGNADDVMRQCMANAKYAARRMGYSDYTAQSDCAKKLNLYHEQGHWYSYDEARR